MSTTQSEGYFVGNDGSQRYEQWWLPEGQIKGVVTIMHGLAEHSGRYQHVGESLASRGYLTGAFDLVGHGRSEGRKACLRSFDDYLDDLEIFLERARARAPKKPQFLLGHSLGGAIACLYAISRQPQLTGLILTGPALRISDEISPLLQRLSSVVAALLPTLPTVILDSSHISRDPQVVARYDSDPLVYRGGTPARTGAELIRATKRIQQDMEALTLPVLIMHGTADKLADPQGSRDLYARAASTDKTLKLYQDYYHEVLNEPEKGQVIADLIAWLDAHS